MVRRTKYIWGGRLDIILEKRMSDGILESVFIGEVKCTDDRDYTVDGLRQLIKYVALIRDRGQYVGNYDNLQYIKQGKWVPIFPGSYFAVSLQKLIYLARNIPVSQTLVFREYHPKSVVNQLRKDEKELKN